MDKENMECLLFNTIPHRVIDAYKLTCGHYVCSKCLNERIVKFQCKHCGTIHDNKMLFAENVTLNRVREKYRLEKINTTCKSSFEHISSQYHDIMSKFEDEIDIRVESLKIELDVLRDKSRNEVIELHNCLLKNISEQRAMLETEMSNLMEIVSDQKQQTTENLENFTIKMKEFYELLNTYNKGVQDEICEMSLDQSVIITKRRSMLTQLETKDHKMFELDERIKKLISLPDHRLGFVIENAVELYDTKTNCRISKQFTSISDIEIQDNNIYIASGRKIIMTDLELNVLKELENMPEEYVNSCIRPCSIQVYNSFLYAYDSANSTIIKLTTGLEIVKFLKIMEFVKYTKIEMKIASNGIVCIIANDTFCKRIGFYDVNNDFKMIYEYINECSKEISLCMCWDEFYIFENNTYKDFEQVIQCYKNSGELKDTFTIIKPFDFMSYKSVHNLNNCLYCLIKPTQNMHDYVAHDFDDNYGRQDSDNNNDAHDSDNNYDAHDYHDNYNAHNYDNNYGYSRYYNDFDMYYGNASP